MKKAIVVWLFCFSLAVGCEKPAEPVPPPAPVLLAEFQVWHGMAGHRYPPYDSRDPAVIVRQITAAKAMGIGGFVVNWYGPADIASNNDEERTFQDQATAVLIEQAAGAEFKVALLYDEGTVKRAEAETGRYQSRIVSDLDYARRYFASPAYLVIRGRAALFVFPYDDVEPFVDWGVVRETFASPVTLLDKDPDPLDPTDHDRHFDGFYAWVTATGSAWDPAGREWGEAYLNWFYPVMGGGDYAGKVLVGGVWPGFDDTLASWGGGRYMARRDTEIYSKTMALAVDNHAPYVMIDTWNDFEEGTDIEFGAAMTVDLDDAVTEDLLRSSPLQVLWSAAHANPVLQVYKGGNPTPLFNQPQAPGVFLALKTGERYEIKLWAGGLPAPGWISRFIVVRHQDPVPGAAPIVIDE